MTLEEMYAEFKFMLDKVASSSAPLFLESEIKMLLNIAQDKFITKRLYGNNVRRTGFEEDQKRRDDLRTLIHQANLTPREYSYFIFGEPGYHVDEDKFSTLFFELPYSSAPYREYRHALLESAVIETVRVEDSNRTVPVKPIALDRYHKIMDDPFNKPHKDTVYRLDYGGQASSATDEPKAGFMQLVFDKDQNVTNYLLKYLAHPLAIGHNNTYGCQLPTHTHREIVRMAVVEALEGIESPRYQSSKIELNEIE